MLLIKKEINNPIFIASYRKPALFMFEKLGENRKTDIQEIIKPARSKK